MLNFLNYHASIDIDPHTEKPLHYPLSLFDSEHVGDSKFMLFLLWLARGV